MQNKIQEEVLTASGRIILCGERVRERMRHASDEKRWEAAKSAGERPQTEDFYDFVNFDLFHVVHRCINS